MLQLIYRPKMLWIRVSIILLTVLAVGNGLYVAANEHHQGEATPIIPRGLPQITAENANLLQPVAKFGRGTPQNLRWTEDGSRLIVIGHSSLWVYEADDFSEPVQHLDLSGDFRRLVDADLSPDGNTAIVAEIQRIQLWDMTGERDPVLLTEFPDHLRDAAIAFNPDGSVAYATPEFSVHLRNISTDETLVFEGHSGLIRSLAFSSDGLLMVTASEDGTARLWNTQNGEELHQFSLAELPLVAAAFSPDGNNVAISAGRAYQAGYNPNEPPPTYPIAVFDLVSYQQGPIFTTTNTPASLSFSADGGYLADHGNVFDIEQGTQVDVPSLTEGRFTRFSPHGDLIATLSAKGPQILSASDYSIQTTLPYFGFIQFVDFDPVANLMMWQAGFTTQLIDLETGLVHADLQGKMGRFLMDNGELIALTQGSFVEWWDIETQSVVRALNVPEDIGTMVLSADGGRLLYNTLDGVIELWDVETQTLIFQTNLNEQIWGELRFSGDEQLIMHNTFYRTRIWEIETGATLIDIGNLNLGANAISPDGRIFAYQLRDEAIVNVADSRTGEILAQFPILTGSGTGIQFNSAGTWMTVGSSNYLGGDGAVHVINVENLEEIAVYDFKGLPWGARFSPDDRFMTLVGESETLHASVVELWNLDTGEQVAIVEGITGGSQIRYNVDQTLLITGAGTVDAHVINTQTGNVVKVLEGQGSGAINYWFSPDGTFIANAAGDGTVWLWGVVD